MMGNSRKTYGDTEKERKGTGSSEDRELGRDVGKSRRRRGIRQRSGNQHEGRALQPEAQKTQEVSGESGNRKEEAPVTRQRGAGLEESYREGSGGRAGEK